ncbi:MAG: filamentous hemagglutinin N-terminal domain-containing protein [Pasteurellaceae bacterium]|nr:filamentous hemagglutinin N-terminal domain-containing protein [Pasteurellaceae bacterium]
MRKLNLISLGIYSMFIGGVVSAQGLPQNGQVRIGEATISTSGGDMLIKQETPKINIEWDSFNIGAANKVTFQQPSEIAVAYNRVTGGNASEIQGKLEANGRVFLANPDGVIFGKNASVNVGAILATTKVLAEGQDLSRSDLRFVRAKSNEGEVKNQGKIKATGQNGFIVLVGDKVKNEGKLEADNFSKTVTTRKRICTGGPTYAAYCDNGWYGYEWVERDITETISTPAQIILAAGENFELDLNERANAISVSVDANTLAQLVENNGVVIANNGYIELTAKGADQAIDTLINNNGILEANTVSQQQGKITLSASHIHLGENSKLKADREIEFTAPVREKKAVQIVSKKGSEILAENTNIKVSKLSFEGEFNRGENTALYSEELGQKNKFNIEVDGKLSVAEQKTEAMEGSFISNTALASMLGNSKSTSVTLKLHRNPVTKQLEHGNFELSGNLAVNSFRNSDSLLKINTTGFSLNDATIKANNGRLNIVTELAYQRSLRPDGVDTSVNLRNTTLDLGKGSIGFGRVGRSGYYLNRPANSVEDEQRSYFDVNIQKLGLQNVDDFVIAGGFGQVMIDGLTHKGRANFYLHGGNSRIWGLKTPAWEYGVQNIEERTLRSRKHHDCERCRRWTYSTELSENYVAREFFDTYDLWNVAQNKQHLDTQITIKNSNIQTHDGFVHLMAKNINVQDSDIGISFDRPLTHDTLQRRLHKLGMNGKIVLDNSHIKVSGADIRDSSPDARQAAAGFFLLGELVGKNKSSIFVKTHQGYTLRTDGNTTLKGEQSKDDLKITLVNTGIAPDLNVGITDDYPDVANTAFSPGDAANTKTVVENLTLNVIAPNGAPAYYSSDSVPIEIKNADVSFFEQPRVHRKESASFRGEAKQITHREALQAIDQSQGIAPTNLSSEQVSVMPKVQQTLDVLARVEQFSAEKNVAVEVCQEEENCESLSLGNQHTEAKVSIGELK